jgi:tripartite-type tricarboxylate transporter receptor subunit TctC
MSEQNTFLVVRASSETKSLKDAENRVTPLAASGASGSDYLLANILNTIYLTKFKSVLGYQSSPQMDMAIQRGEADGRFTASLAGLFSTSKEGAQGFRILVQIGSKPDAGFPDAPFLKKIPSDQPEAVNIISSVMSLGRPVATNSGVPADRVAILRTAFDETMKDADFLRDAGTQQLDISPWSGAETQKVVDEIIHANGSTKEFLSTAITSDKND